MKQQTHFGKQQIRPGGQGGHLGPLWAQGKALVGGPGEQSPPAENEFVRFHMPQKSSP